MNGLIVSAVAVAAGGSLATASMLGLVDSQTSTPDKSPTDASSVTIDYGNTQ